MSRSTVLVIGGGPAGSTAATLLARSGIEVEVFEREHFPRYHIGESTLPACQSMLDLLAAREKVEDSGFRHKTGQYFRWGDEQWDYRFGALTGNLVYSWQVERADFDRVLLDHAAEQGARVHQGRKIVEIHFDGDRPVAVTWVEPETKATGRHEFDYLIDASGRAGIMVNRYLGGRRLHESFRNVAVWGYWNGCRQLPQAPAGATVVSSIPEGWIWAIPLRDRRVSVGAVMHKRRFTELRDAGTALDAIYHDSLREARDLPEILRDATFEGQIRVDQDYSYTAERFCGPGFFISGDAACFLDPLLSTGIHLAMFSALLAAASICTLQDGLADELTVARFYDESYRRTYLRFLVIVAAVYRQYDGKDTYFWQAQDLLLGDRHIDKDLLGSFLSVVAGVADFDEMTTQQIADLAVERTSTLFREVHKEFQDRIKSSDLTESEREVIRAKAQYWNSAVQAFALDPGSAVAGMYVVTAPRLGLRLVRSGRRESAATGHQI